METKPKKGKSHPNQLEKGASLIPPRPATIPTEQWSLPAGFKADGSFASLAEVVADPIPTFTLEESPPLERKNLVVKRLEKQPDYPTKYMLGVGVVNRERAIAEVKALTPAGKAIQESEERVIQSMRDQARQTSATRN